MMPGDGAHPLTSYSVTSRPSLSGYGRGYQQKEPETNILNESGQSVPQSFEDRGGSKQIGDRRMEDVDMPQHLFGKSPVFHSLAIRTIRTCTYTTCV